MGDGGGGGIIEHLSTNNHGIFPQRDTGRKSKDTSFHRQSALPPKKIALNVKSFQCPPQKAQRLKTRAIYLQNKSNRASRALKTSKTVVPFT